MLVLVRRPQKGARIAFAVFLFALFWRVPLRTGAVAGWRVGGAAGLPWGSVCARRTGIVRDMLRSAAWQRRPNMLTNMLSVL